MTTTMTQTEINHANALVTLVMRDGSTTLDELLNKWSDNGYRPSLRTDAGEIYTQLADYYDRRAAERGIDVRAYRGFSG